MRNLSLVRIVRVQTSCSFREDQIYARKKTVVALFLTFLHPAVDDEGGSILEGVESVNGAAHVVSKGFRYRIQI